METEQNKRCEACSGSGYVYTYPNSTKKCSVCGGTGSVEMVLPVPFSNGDVVERTEEPCPACGQQS